MISKKDFFIGMFMGLAGSVLGSFIYVALFGNFGENTILYLKSHGLLGKIITLGSILDLAIFAILLKLNKETMAKGVVMAVIVVTIITIFV